jgi:Flp pilus assembly pilin Flp
VHRRANHPQRGAASVEHVGLAMLVATALLAGVAAFAAGPPVEDGRELGTAITRKLRCAPRLPGPCWRDRLTDAYGRPLAGLVRALAPAPEPRAGPGGTPLVGVDFRYCRSAGCAAWTGDERLTASNRRTTAFTSVEDRRRSGRGVEVTYWIYRPSLGWERVVRRAGSADVAAAAKTPLLESASPKLVPLETLAGRNHYDFPRFEEPPWRWRVEPVYPG